MFDYNKMIKRAIEFFPQWTDIRKRYKTSTGGRLISTLLEETVDIEKAIQEYIDSYFLYNYIGHENEIMAYVYKADIGQLELKKGAYVEYENVLFPIIYDTKDFEANKNSAYYENNQIFFHVEHYREGVDTIKVHWDYGEENAFVFKINKTNVWNIFDEFATFVGIRRQENETNSQLVNRILYVTKNMPSSTEDGIKSAIIAELMTICPEIEKEDIKIEIPTPENLIKPYEDFETLLDFLEEINRDAYRTKRWDIDYWEYDFESISYIPHTWDKVIKDWKNGVGSYNDLEVIIADAADTTTATIYFYKKTLEDFQKYVYDKYIEDEISFTMTKYSDSLKVKNLYYTIQASELEDITNADINLKIYESNKVNETIPIENVATDWGENIEVVDNNIITDEKDYQYKFLNKKNEDLIISKAEVLYLNKNTDELIEKIDLIDPNTPGFIYNSEYELVSTAHKLSVRSIENFNYTRGLINVSDGVTLDEDEYEGEATLSMTDVAGMYLGLDYYCDPVSLPNHIIKCPAGYWDESSMKSAEDNANKKFVVRGDYSIENKKMTIELNANFLSFNISEDNLNSKILMTLTDEAESEIIYKDFINTKTFETKITDKPRNIKIELDIVSVTDTVFSNFLYKNYVFDLSTEQGSLTEIKNDDGVKYKLGPFYNNKLKLTISSKIGTAPVLKNLFITDKEVNIEYETSIVSYKPNCYRVLDFRTNGDVQVTDIKSDYKTFTPVRSFKAVTGKKAYLRLDLDDYDYIDEISSDGGAGTISTFNKNGKIYYELALENAEAAYLTIKGSRLKEARIVTLMDMVKFYIPDFNLLYDKIYSSKISNGLVIGRANPGKTSYNAIINIESKCFTGIKAVKYVMHCPENMGCIYGTNSGDKHISYSTTNTFDYIGFYPANSKIYTASNEIELYELERRNIPISNNFTPELTLNKLLFYKVELNDDTYKDSIKVRFHNALTANYEIDELSDWSIGTSNSYIAIQHDTVLNNKELYSSTTFDIDTTEYLSSSVDIKDSYTLTNNIILDTERYIIETKNPNVKIKYDFYDGTEMKAHLLKYEEVLIDSTGFNKLAYSNIDKIYHISFSPFEDNYVYDLYESATIMNEQGIIIWNDREIIRSNTKVYLVYSIKKPVAFVFDLEYLYKAINYDVDAYGQTSTYILDIPMKDKSLINLNNKKNNTFADLIELYEESDLMYIVCDEETFKADYNFGTKCITFNKFIEGNSVLVKTGYYYINGIEFYLFNEEDTEEITNNELYKASDVDISGGEITTYKETNNYIYNSEMRLKGMSNLYNFNCKSDLTYGISKLNRLTSCESFNEWSVHGTTLSLVDGLNGLALKFNPEIDNGYSYLDITDSLVSDVLNYISLYASEELIIYIGREDAEFSVINRYEPYSIEIFDEMKFNNSDVRTLVIEPKQKYKYYLIVTGRGLIDDIILSTDESVMYRAHVKNIDLLGFNLYEKKPEGTRYRMSLKTHRDYTPYHAGLMSDGYLKTTSSIDWHVTKVFGLDTGEEFKSHILNNVHVSADRIYTLNNKGSIEIGPIFINELDNIKELIFKINDLKLENMQGFITTIETSKLFNSDYRACGVFSLKNCFSLDASRLDRYIKIKIQMPANKIIDNIKIYANYISTNKNPLPITVKDSGYIVSKVFDLQETTNCIVKAIDIIDVGNINDIEVYIRCSRDNDRLDVWHDWKKMNISKDFKISNKITFNNTRFLQFKVVLKNRNAYVKIKGIDIEIK